MIPMKKHLIGLLVSLCFLANAWYQSSPLVVQGESGKLYLLHGVEAGENWYSVGRMYNISPREIAPFNGETLEQPLVIGQQLKIPLKLVNFSQDGLKGTGESLVPVYHLVQEKEWLYKISPNYNAVPIENLEKWNHVSRDHAKKGMQLIVGFLKVKASQSSLAKMAVSPDRPVNPVPDQEVKREDIASENNHLTKTESKQVNSPADNSETKPVNSYSNSHPSGAGGYFKPDYSGGTGSVTGIAGIFKSTSGWQDGKYYALMNNVQVGTIVKVTNAGAHKSIYAKVLGQLPEMKESEGLTIRISNAAASELGTDQTRFPIEIKF
jgi:hypothetical protein